MTGPCPDRGTRDDGPEAVRSPDAASLARQLAFEETVRAAGRVLEAELAAAGADKTARRAAWARYGDVQDAAGAAFRAAARTSGGIAVYTGEQET